MFTPATPLTVPESPFLLAAGTTPGDPLLAWCQFDQQHWQAELHQRWQLPLPAALEKAVMKRKSEHLASRWLARAVMSQFGVADFLLLSAPDRSPCWPAGVQASLSHSQNQVVMAATREPLCVGVDVEQVMAARTAQETADMLMNAQERALLQQLALPFATGATLLFSLKESVYKALWPQLHQPMEFLQAELIQLDLTTHTARLRLTQDFSAQFNRQTLLQARFSQSEQRVVTLVTHPLAGQ
ncbi:4'-phosphopantetheinyl transferase superfamily protein [Pantoea cypripedii]|uniref:4'-phosphopantetheinyl transferase family protein n=1 Tax=Pantoea cypripedii TaxID=55209 RepID=UPI002FCBEAEF